MSRNKETQKLFEICQRKYEEGGYAAVIEYIEEAIRQGEDTIVLDVEYKPCRACDNDMPSLKGICLVCGQPVAKVKYNVWVEIERVEEYDDDEVYRDEDNPIKIGIRDTLEDAVELQNEVANAYGEMSFPVPAFSADFIEKIKEEKRQAMADNEE